MQLVVSEAPQVGSPALPPEMTPSAVSKVLRRCLSAMEDEPGLPEGVIAAEVAPNDGETALLQKRKAELLKGLKPARELPGDRLVLTLTALLGAFKASIRQDDATLTVALYKRACRDLPLWAVQTAAERFITGKLGSIGVAWNPSYPPTTAQVAEASRQVRPILWLDGNNRSARATVVELETELAQINRVLAVKVVGRGVTEAARAEVQARAAEVIALLKSGPDAQAESIERNRAEMAKANQLLNARERDHHARIAAIQAAMEAEEARAVTISAAS